MQMNQSGLEAHTRNRRQARENACDHVMIGFGLAFHWLKNVAGVLLTKGYVRELGTRGMYHISPGDRSTPCLFFLLMQTKYLFSRKTVFTMNFKYFNPHVRSGSGT